MYLIIDELSCTKLRDEASYFQFYNKKKGKNRFSPFFGLTTIINLLFQFPKFFLNDT